MSLANERVQINVVSPDSMSPKNDRVVLKSYFNTENTKK